VGDDANTRHAMLYIRDREPHLINQSSIMSSSSSMPFIEDNKISCKRYYYANREQRKEGDAIRAKAWYEKNKNVFVTCECGCKVIKANMASHKKTQKHINAMCSTSEDENKIKCECGCSVLKKHLKRHTQSKKHQRLLCLPCE